ncbi:MAG: hypothetical protein PHH86_05070, partial [Sphaerochaetaceae bacterium]|nr:hypothetical protein [Sphaerochaetaceae bacterium]
IDRRDASATIVHKDDLTTNAQNGVSTMIGLLDVLKTAVHQDDLMKTVREEETMTNVQVDALTKIDRRDASTTIVRQDVLIQIENLPSVTVSRDFGEANGKAVPSYTDSINSNRRELVVKMNVRSGLKMKSQVRKIPIN